MNIDSWVATLAKWLVQLGGVGLLLFGIGWLWWRLIDAIFKGAQTHQYLCQFVYERHRAKVLKRRMEREQRDA